MRIANRQFKPALAGTLATVLLLPAFISLGAWQLRRADEKRALIEQFQTGASTTQVLSHTNGDTLMPLQQVIAHGRYDPTHQVLLDNMPSARHELGGGRAMGGLPGYHVLTPLQLDDGYVVLVDRGWVSLGHTRMDLPNVDVGTDARSLRGRSAELPRPGFHMKVDVSVDLPWPRVLNFPTVAELRKLYGAKLLSHIVLLDAAEPDGFEREWSARFTFGEFGPERHIGYAIQWFAFAFTLIVIYFLVSFRPLPRDSL